MSKSNIKCANDDFEAVNKFFSLTKIRLKNFNESSFETRKIKTGVISGKIKSIYCNYTKRHWINYSEGIDQMAESSETRVIS